MSSVFSRLSALFSTRASAARSPETMASVKSYVDELIASKKVVVFSKSYCPYCHKAKAALESFNLAPGAMDWIEIEQREDMGAIQDYMAEITGGRSVPRVFINGKFLGGGDDTVAAKKNGSLEAKLKEAGLL